MKIVLVSDLMKYGKLFIKSNLEHTNLRSKGVKMKLHSESMEEATHLITEMMKLDIVRKVYGAKIILIYKIASEQ